MTKNEILSKIKSLKESLKNDGFIIDGVFGSLARNDFSDSSDVDILYHLEEAFFEKYGGFVGFKRLDEIKQIISREVGKRVDIAPKNALSKTGKKYILNEVVYV